MSMVLVAGLLMGTAAMASSGGDLKKKGISLYQKQEFAKAAQIFGSASKAYEKGKDMANAADCSYNRGLCLGKVDGVDLLDQAKAYERAGVLYGKAGRGDKQLNAFIAGAQVYLRKGDLAKAEAIYADAEPLAEKLKKTLFQGLALEGLGKVAMTRGQIGRATELFQKAVPLVKGSVSASVRVGLQIAACIQKNGDFKGAMAICDEAIVKAAPLKKDKKTEALGRILLFSSYSQRANALNQLGCYEESQKTYSRALEEVEKLSSFDDRQRLMVDANVVVAQGELGNVRFAAETLKSVEQRAVENGWATLEFMALQARGRLLRVDGDYRGAYDCYFRSRNLAKEKGLKNGYLQAVTNIADLYYAMGMWDESKDSYREAIIGSLEQGDMEIFLIASLGFNRVARGEDLGLSGKVDYRSLVGVPWQGLTMPEGRLKKDRFFSPYWKALDKNSELWFRPSSILRSDRTVEAVSRMLGWNRTGGIARFAVADGVFRLAESRLSVLEKLEQGIRGLKGEGCKVPVQFWIALRRGAGERLLSGAVGPMVIRTEGLMLEGDEPESKYENESSKELAGSLEVVAHIPSYLGMDKKAEASLVKDLSEGRSMPSSVRSGLASYHGARAKKQSEKPEVKKGMDEAVLDLVRSITGKKISSSDLGTDTGSLSSFMICQIKGAELMVDQVARWNDIATRAALLKELGVRIGPVSSMEEFLEKFPPALDKGRKRLDSLKDDLEKLASLGSFLARMEIRRERKLCRETLKAHGGLSFDNRQAMDLLIRKMGLSLGDPSGAATALDNLKEEYGFVARTATGTIPNPDLAWRSTVLSAKARFEKGDRAGGLSLLRDAISVIESISPAEGTESRATADRLEAYTLTIDSSYRRWQETKSDEDMEEVWRALESMKSRQWRELLSTTGMGFLNRLSPEERDVYRDLKGEVTTLEGGIKLAYSKGDLGTMVDYASALQSKRKELDEFMSGHTVVGSVEVPTTGQIQDLVPSDWAVADYYISPEISFAFVIRKGRPVALVPLELDYSLFFAYVTTMRRDKAEEFSLMRTNDSQRIFGLNGRDLERWLLAPLRAHLGKVKNILVIPHDVLFLYPYETMVAKDGSENRYLLDLGWNFAEIPSASLIVHGSYGERSCSDSAAVVANPKYLYFGGARKEEKIKLKEVLSDAESPIDAAVRLRAGPCMTPLDGTQEEANHLSSIWKEAGRDVACLVGENASEFAMASADIGSYGYVHFACHGYDRHSIPFLQPGLALSPASDRENDSFAQMGELAAINWRSRLVVLSACDTGLGDLYVGDGMIGLNSVFLSGGVQGVVVSRWLVPDAVAPVIMRGMYSAISKGVSPAEALNGSKRQVLEGGEQPTGWAVLKYVGIPWEIESK
ncbi:CHAT domain-containing tetratricopeptide repeat protein [Dethiosulfovibrio sp. F2B]|uniref:CHAT domain-containing tetratricopeptide repeat protein n=1 Tax=Dethiosulfovibrio faecalis TaxID=2720018 RepID=UPI001F28385E|nr:CHAT domain-containing tetratricopeptide repeat protein [Dethiosulfovibrio faecalis]MCF4152409.1 CHAT domain-containing tetratricopeptide repeat protein [Dethiosulfovibrio faecalis]